MRTAVDSSVLLAIFTGETGAEQWMESLIQARREGQLLICEVVYAELAPAFAAIGRNPFSSGRSRNNAKARKPKSSTKPPRINQLYRQPSSPNLSWPVSG